VALAEPPVPTETDSQKAVAELVNKQIVAPLTKSERRRSRFSRAAPVAMQRRVRVLDTTALTDVQGKAFVRFAIDERRGRGEQAAWINDAHVGCAYPGERTLFVRDGDRYLSAASLLGAKAEEQPKVCRAAKSNSVEVASAR